MQPSTAEARAASPVTPHAPPDSPGTTPTPTSSESPPAPPAASTDGTTPLSPEEGKLVSLLIPDFARILALAAAAKPVGVAPFEIEREVGIPKHAVNSAIRHIRDVAREAGLIPDVVACIVESRGAKNGAKRLVRTELRPDVIQKASEFSSSSTTTELPESALAEERAVRQQLDARMHGLLDLVIEHSPPGIQVAQLCKIGGLPLGTGKHYLEAIRAAAVRAKVDPDKVLTVVRPSIDGVQIRMLQSRLRWTSDSVSRWWRATTRLERPAMGVEGGECP